MSNKKSKATSKVAKYLKLSSLFWLIVILFFVFLSGYFIFKYLEKTNFFTISYIQVINRPILGDVSVKYFYDLVGAKANIFKVDSQKLKESVESDFPQLEEVIIVKRFPDRLIFNLVGRHVLAQISLSKKRYFDVNSDGFILPVSRPDPNPDFPLILGLNRQRALLKPNQKSTSPLLLYALSFIKQYREYDWLPEERLVALDVSNEHSISLFLRGNLKVKILKSEVEPKIKILEGLLEDIRINNPKAKYIDLRFKDVIINPKND